MIIDIICLILLVIAIFKGYSNGLIVALFSFASLIIGLAAATKLSAIVANYLRTHVHLPGYWLPVISFLIVFTCIVFLVRWSARILKKAVRVAFLGWADALGGIILYAFIYMMIFSVVLFFADQIHFISGATELESKTYSFVKPFGPKVINAVGAIIPFFKNMFSELQHFFQAVSDKAK